MYAIDIRTFLLSMAAASAIASVVLGLLWHQNRHRFEGVGLWLTHHILLATAVSLIALRTRIPDLFSIVVANFLLIGGVFILLVGLERFFGTRGPRGPNSILLSAFAALHVYFTYIQPSISARETNVALGILVFASQCAWLLFQKASPEMQQMAKRVGTVFLGFSLVSVIWAIEAFFAPPAGALLKPFTLNTLIVLAYGILIVMLAFGLILLVNSRLLLAVQTYAAERDTAARELDRRLEDLRRSEEGLRRSEERFRAQYDGSPTPISHGRREGKTFFSRTAIVRRKQSRTEGWPNSSEKRRRKCTPKGGISSTTLSNATSRKRQSRGSSDQKTSYPAESSPWLWPLSRRIWSWFI
jgi:hypothetical protein